MQTELGFRSVVPTLCLHPVPDDSFMCSVTCKKWYLLNPPGKEFGNCFCTRPKLLVASPPVPFSVGARDRAITKVEMAANMCISQRW